MKSRSENIRESEVEDALLAQLDILRELLDVGQGIRLIARQLRLIDGQRRLDILLAAGGEIVLVELKTEPFHLDHLQQILNYKEKLEGLQQERQLIAGTIVPILLVTGFSRTDADACHQMGVRVCSYSPLQVLTKYYDRLASVANFMRVRPKDLGVFNIGLINRVIGGLENGLTTVAELSVSTQLSGKSMAHHLEFACEFGLVTRRRDRFFLTDLGLEYASYKDTMLTDTDLSSEQATLLRSHIARDPFSSPIVFGIYTIVESMFFLARNSYPVDLEELKGFFLRAAGKKNDWQAPKSLSTATYTYLNYASKLGLLAKIGKQVVITPAGFRFILMLQLYKSIEMVGTLASQSETQPLTR